jgi:hypothetical protein
MALGFSSAILVIGIIMQIFIDMPLRATPIIFMIFVGSILVLRMPKHSTKIILIFRFFGCLYLIYGNIKVYEGKIPCDEPAPIQILFYKSLFQSRQFCINLYILLSTFVTPLADQYFLMIVTSSIYFAIEYYMLQKYYPIQEAWDVLQIPVWYLLMFI